MAYDDDKGKVGQNWVWFVQINPRTCTRTYGSYPCFASGGQCAYSWSTCEYPSAFGFSDTSKVYYFSSKHGKKVQAFAYFPVMPTLLSVSDLATELNPNKSTTLNARMQLTFEDVKNPPPFNSEKGAGKYYEYRNSTFWRIFTKIYEESYRYCRIRIYEGLAEYTTIADFKDHYQNEHDFAEDDTDVPSEQKAKLILCGFKHAIDALKETL